MTAAYEEPVDPTRLCYFCTEPAVQESYVTLASEYDVTLATIGALGAPIRGAIRVTADACDSHSMALVEALFDATGAGSLGGQGLTRSTCPDAWHTHDEAYEESATGLEPVGGGWLESHYECPTCGFSTGGLVVAPESVTDDPAYIYVRTALARICASAE